LILKRLQHGFWLKSVLYAELLYSFKACQPKTI